MTDVFLGIIAVSVLVMAIVQVAAAMMAAARRAARRRRARPSRGRRRPIVANVQEIATNVQRISADAARATAIATAQVERAERLMDDVTHARRRDDDRGAGHDPRAGAQRHGGLPGCARPRSRRSSIAAAAVAAADARSVARRRRRRRLIHRLICAAHQRSRDRRRPRSPRGSPAAVVGCSAAQARTPPAPGLVFAFEARVEVGAPVEIGQMPRGRRRIVPILSGTFEGPGIKGTRGARRSRLADHPRRRLQRARHALHARNRQGTDHLRAERRHAACRAGGDGEAAARARPSIRSWSTSARSRSSRHPRRICSGLTRAVFIGTGERYPTEVVIRFWRVE